MTPSPGSMHVKKGAGDALWFMGELYEIKVDGSARGGPTVVQVTVPPGPVLGAPPHLHDCDEVAYVLPSTATRLLIRQRFGGVASSLLPESRRPGNGRDSRWVEIAACTGSVIMIAKVIYMDNNGYLCEIRQSPGRTPRASEDLSK